MTAVPTEQDITGTRQLRAWHERVLPPVEELGGDLWSVPVPIPDSPLRYVSCYAFAAAAGLVLLDSGWNSDESWRALLAGLREIGAGPADVRGVAGQPHALRPLWPRRTAPGGLRGMDRHPADHAVLAVHRDPVTAAAAEVAFLRSLGGCRGRTGRSASAPSRRRPPMLTNSSGAASFPSARARFRPTARRTAWPW